MPDRVKCPWCHATYRKGDENREYVCVLCKNRPLSKELLAAYLLLGDEFNELLLALNNGLCGYDERIALLDVIEGKFRKLRADVLGKDA